MKSEFRSEKDDSVVISFFVTIMFSVVILLSIL